MATKISFQQVQKSYSSEFEVARMYYCVMMQLSKLSVTPKELDLIAFCSIKGTISTPPVRNEFISTFGIPKASVYNMVSKLQKQSIMIKGADNKIRVNPQICLDFSNPEILLSIKLKRKDGN